MAVKRPSSDKFEFTYMRVMLSLSYAGGELRMTVTLQEIG